MRKIYIAGNWKMNKTFQEADEFLFNLGEYLEKESCDKVRAVIFPSFPYLELITDLSDTFSISSGAQNVSEFVSGAYTGEVSAEMLASMEVEYCLVGHSERRHIFSESSEMVNKKAKQLMANYVKPVVCIGETLEEREAGRTEEVILSQLAESLKDIEIKGDLLIAYEPVWAIGTGKTATPEIAQEVHKLIRHWLEKHYGKGTAEETPILYGGSVKPSNLQQLLVEKDIDGGLTGGASLDIKSFTEMLEIAAKINKE